MRIKFTEDALYENEGRGQGHKFVSGEVYDLPDDQAQRWVRRGVAERLDVPDGFKPITRTVARERASEDEPGAAVPTQTSTPSVPARLPAAPVSARDSAATPAADAKLGSDDKSPGDSPKK